MSKQSMIVSAEHAGRMLDALVRIMHAESDAPMSWNRARDLVRRGKVSVDGKVATDITLRIGQGAKLVLDLQARVVREHELPREAILYVDDDIVVVNKPAGLMTVPYEDEEHTLVDQTQLALKRGSNARGPARGSRTGRAQNTELGVVQRLDKDTTGVLVFARTLDAKRHLQQQFRVHSIERRYLAIVHGELRTAATYESDFIQDRGDGLKGSFAHFRRPRGPLPHDAQHAITHVRPVQPLKEATLVECKLETGRQHQIRIHLSEHGHPIAGEQVYIRDYEGERIKAARPMLHARVLGFTHPRSGEALRFSVEPPDDFAKLRARLTLR